MDRYRYIAALALGPEAPDPIVLRCPALQVSLLYIMSVYINICTCMYVNIYIHIFKYKHRFSLKTSMPTSIIRLQIVIRRCACLRPIIYTLRVLTVPPFSSLSISIHVLSCEGRS